jgi:spermidine synthase
VLIVALDAAASRITNILGADVMSLGILVRSVLLITALFFLPSAALGCVSPVMAKYALEGDAPVGRTVGGIYAWGALGSIAGTFLTGFLLIPFLGLSAVILAVGIGLAFLALLLGGWRVLSGAWLAALVVLAATGAPQALGRKALEGLDSGRLVYVTDSPYSYIQVTDRGSGAGVERRLRLDALIHNRYSPARPDELLYEYERIFALATAGAAARGDFSSLTIGGGGFTLPSYLARHYPRARNEVVEIDPAVVETAFRFFDLPRDTRIRIAVEDARAFVARVSGKRTYDIVYCDAFNAFSVPYHLTTVEFLRSVASILSPDGLYLANCIDVFDSGRFLAAFLQTLRAVFPAVSVYVPPDSSWDARTTFVLAAGANPPEADVLREPDGTVAGTRVPPDQLAGLIARTAARVLTDDRAPVENLMAPVFLRSVR